MNVRKVINKVFDHDADGVKVRATVQAVIAANVNEDGPSTVSAEHRDDGRPAGEEGGPRAREEH